MMQRKGIPGLLRKTAVAMAYTCTMSAMPQEYLVFDLGVLEAGESSWAYGINNLNHIVGEAHVDYPVKQAFIWLAAPESSWDNPFDVSGMIALGQDGSVARKINDDSVVVGDVDGSSAFMWQATAVVASWDLFELIGLPDVSGGLGSTVATALDFESDPLRIVGTAWVETGTFDDQVGFVWRSDAPTTAPTILTGPDATMNDPHFLAHGISPHTQIGAGETVEFGTCSGCPFFGLEWELDPLSTEADRLPALSGQDDSGRGLDASDAGLIVGQLEDESVTKNHAVLWHWLNPGDVLDLHDDATPALGQFDDSIARAIRNDALQIVGANESDNEAMLWQWDSVAEEWESVVLNDTIRDCDWELVEAYDVNENGWIVGSGFRDSEVHAYVLVPRDRACTADITGPEGVPDGYVNTSDLLAVLASWGACATCDQCPADTDDSGAVNVTDLMAVLGSWSNDRFACDGTGEMPQTVEDCIAKIGYSDPVALAACIELVTGGP